MGDGVGPGQFSDFDLALGDQRPGDRRAEQVFALVDGVGPEHGKHEIPHEFLAQVINIDIFRLDPELQRFAPRRLQLLALAQVGGEGHHFALIHVLQPFQDDRGIQATRIGQHDFLDIGHIAAFKNGERKGWLRSPAVPS